MDEVWTYNHEGAALVPVGRLFSAEAPIRNHQMYFRSKSVHFMVLIHKYSFVLQVRSHFIYLLLLLFTIFVTIECFS